MTRQVITIEKSIIEATLKTNNLVGIILLYVEEMNRKKLTITHEIRNLILTYAQSENKNGQWDNAAIIYDRLKHNDSLIYHRQLK